MFGNDKFAQVDCKFDLANVYSKRPQLAKLGVYIQTITNSPCQNAQTLRGFKQNFTLSPKSPRTMIYFCVNCTAMYFNSCKAIDEILESLKIES